MANDRRSSRRYLLSATLTYRVPGSKPPIMGSGRVLNISSSGIAFSGDTPLALGMPAAVRMEWPIPSMGRPVYLDVFGEICRADGSTMVINIQRYAFVRSAVRSTARLISVVAADRSGGRYPRATRLAPAEEEAAPRRAAAL